MAAPISYTYLIVGGGMTAAAAVAGIREIDRKGTIGLIAAEPHPPYDRPPLSKALWRVTLVEASNRGATMLSYEAARDALVNELRANAVDHEARRYDTIGRRFDRIEHEFPTGTAPELGRLHIALAFWDGWIDARNNGWPRALITESDWPTLARAVADDLAADHDISNPLVLVRFDLVANPQLNERVQTLAARLRNR